MKRCTVYLLLNLCSVALFAQHNKADSLYTVLKIVKEDTNRVNALNDLSSFMEDEGNYQRSDSLAKKALQLAIKIDFKNGEVNAYGDIGVACEDVGNYPEAIKNQLHCLKISEENNFKAEMAVAYINLGNIYEDQGNHSEALKNLSEGLKIDQEINNKYGMGIAYTNIGTCYETLCNYPEALKNYLQGLKIAEEIGNKHAIGSAYTNIGNIYCQQTNYAEALKSYLQALEIDKELVNKNGMGIIYMNIGATYEYESKYQEAFENYSAGLKIEEEIGNKSGISYAYLYLGGIYFKEGNYKDALTDQVQSLRMSEEIGDKNGIGTAYCKIANVLIKQKNYAEAENYLDSAVTLAKNIGAKDIVRDTYSSLSTLDSTRSNFAGAYKNYVLFIMYRDSLKNDDYTKKLVSEQMQFAFDKKQAEEKEQQDKKDVEASQAKRTQVIIRDTFMVGFVLMIALAFFIFRGYRQKQKANIIITQQKEEVEQQKALVESQKALVEEKQKEIVDSIHYAERIQKALLASDALLGSALRGNYGYASDYFLLYKPKDIVSGDFYWAIGKDNRFYLAVCDSTGHGVPGAFMSLLNISFLNEAINQKNISEPNEVLDHVRKRLVENTSQGQDGMDGILIKLTPLGGSKTETVLSYAGAYNSPVVVRNGEAIELQADKMPVGKSPREKELFTHHTFTLQKGDNLYMFTDGYADQFGGPKGKKLKYAQLKSTLLEIAQDPMQVQKEKLNNFFTQWKGELEQIDDVLIMGIKV